MMAGSSSETPEPNPDETSPYHNSQPIESSNSARDRENTRDFLGLNSGTADAQGAVFRIRKAEINAQNARWVTGCLAFVVCLKIVVDGWSEMNLHVVNWWQSPIIGVAATAIPVAAFFSLLAFMLVFRKSMRRPASMGIDFPTPPYPEPDVVKPDDNNKKSGNLISTDDENS